MGKWTERFLELARNVAEWSKDPNTKVGVGADTTSMPLEQFEVAVTMFQEAGVELEHAK